MSPLLSFNLTFFLLFLQIWYAHRPPHSVRGLSTHSEATPSISASFRTALIFQRSIYVWIQAWRLNLVPGLRFFIWPSLSNDSDRWSSYFHPRQWRYQICFVRSRSSPRYPDSNASLSGFLALLTMVVLLVSRRSTSTVTYFIRSSVSSGSGGVWCFVVYKVSQMGTFVFSEVLMMVFRV